MHFHPAILCNLKSAMTYAAYMGRVGTPDYTPADIEGWVDGALTELFPTPTATP